VQAEWYILLWVWEGRELHAMHDGGHVSLAEIYVRYRAEEQLFVVDLIKHTKRKRGTVQLQGPCLSCMRTHLP
jgi:hypothetical protein